MENAFRIHPELRDYLRREESEENAMLEQSLLSEGCRDPLVVWREENVLVDGHHRCEICERHGIPYTVKYYDSLTNQAPKLMNQNSIALNQANGLLGQGADAVNQAKTAGDWYFDQAKGDYGNAQKYLAQAGTAGDPWYSKAMGAYDSASGLLGQLQNNLTYTREGNKWYDDYTRGMLSLSQVHILSVHM